ncbi:hypothetical protein EXIGLDRAFT_85759 [Exidia glandulosa HHB12029]|uniref:Uncharacterized protein n=1 Tax=Exidia glandulosa HHB12029 TaxID=1314781 RepID=A0A166AH69_EXIGL|nr:hypothetical protein EXIGLDRAFT_85759 [Exidia glandulosa HHB12029]
MRRADSLSATLCDKTRQIHTIPRIDLDRILLNVPIHTIPDETRQIHTIPDDTRHTSTLTDDCDRISAYQMHGANTNRMTAPATRQIHTIPECDLDQILLRPSHNTYRGTPPGWQSVTRPTTGNTTYEAATARVRLGAESKRAPLGRADSYAHAKFEARTFRCWLEAWTWNRKSRRTYLHSAHAREP